MYRLISTLVLFAALASLSGEAGSALGRGGAYVSPKHFVLTKHDVPPSFRLVGARSITNAEADRDNRLPPGTFARHGRITSYETSFRYSGRQFGSVQDNVIAFKSRSGAHWEFLRSVEQGRKPLGGRPFAALHVGHIGDEAAGFLYHQILGTSAVICGIAIFRRGSYTAWVVTCGPAATYLLRISPTLAHIIDRRIQSAR